MQLVKNAKRIKKAFPNLPESFYDLLWERIKANGFTTDDLERVVDIVIDTCLYPQPTVGHFIIALKENTCPKKLIFGESFGNFVGCDTCEDDFHKIWANCKLASSHNK